MIDLNELQQELRKMQRHQPLYRVVRDELKARGNWKPAARGAAFKEGVDERRGDLGAKP